MMKKLIKLLSVLLSCVMLLSLFLPGVRERIVGTYVSVVTWASGFAERFELDTVFGSDEDDGDEEGGQNNGGGESGAESGQNPADNGQKPSENQQKPANNITIVEKDEDLSAALMQAIANRHEEIDVSELGYNPDVLKEEVSRFFFSNPSLFYVNNAFSYYKQEGSNTVKTVVLSYLYDEATSAQMSESYEQTLAQIVAGIPSGASEFDKVLYLHDYLVQNYAYDYVGLAQEMATGEAVAIRDAYTFFEQKRGVCQAYMLAMMALCHKAGIECLPVISDELVHAWNLVQVDGEWYHVDVTWDDAGDEEAAVYPSFVSYQYFLLSDQSLYNGSSTRKPRTQEWETTRRASSAVYDLAKWHEATTPMVKLGQYYYCVLYDKTASMPKLYCCERETVYAVEAFEHEKWYGSSGYYTAAWAGVAVWDGALIISTNAEFYRYDTERDKLTLLADLSATLGNKQIFGICNLDDTGRVTYVVAEDYQGSCTTRTWVIPAG